MNFIETDLPEVIVIEPDVHRDDRGFFLETYHARRYAESTLPAKFVQDNHSRSVARTLRGLHAQIEPGQGKLVRAIEGTIFDVAVDIRRGSPAFANWVGVVLSAENFRQLWIPPGFAHGFCVTSPTAQVEYKCTEFYDPADEIGIVWNDPTIGIDWPIDEPLLSARDAAAPQIGDLSRLPRYPSPAPRSGARSG